MVGGQDLGKEMGQHFAVTQSYIDRIHEKQVYEGKECHTQELRVMKSGLVMG